MSGSATPPTIGARPTPPPATSGPPPSAGPTSLFTPSSLPAGLGGHGQILSIFMACKEQEQHWPHLPFIRSIPTACRVGEPGPTVLALPQRGQGQCCWPVQSVICHRWRQRPGARLAPPTLTPTASGLGLLPPPLPCGGAGGDRAQCPALLPWSGPTPSIRV